MLSGAESTGQFTWMSMSLIPRGSNRPSLQKEALCRQAIMFKSGRAATPDKTRAKTIGSYILSRDKSQNQVSSLTRQQVPVQPQTYNRGEGKGQKAAFKRAGQVQRAQNRSRVQGEEQDRHLVSWLLVLLWGWDLVESVELDSE
jgi:hypothetical protein